MKTTKYESLFIFAATPSFSGRGGGVLPTSIPGLSPIPLLREKLWEKLPYPPPPSTHTHHPNFFYGKNFL